MSLSQGRQAGPPHLVAVQYGIEDDQELPHARREYDLRWLALGQESSPAPGTGIAPSLSARFGYASASGQGQSLGRATLMIETGFIHGGRSASLAIQTIR
jgi:hypothetical protein